MPGGSAASDWGNLPLVVDTSALMRGTHPEIQSAWNKALVSRQFRLSDAARLEILSTARNRAAFDDWARLLSAMRPVPLSAGVARAAEAAMHALAYRSAGAQRGIPVIDYLVAASAEAIGGAVLHYDRDYDRLAEVMEFESVWLVPPGSIP